MLFKQNIRIIDLKTQRKKNSLLLDSAHKPTQIGIISKVAIRLKKKPNPLLAQSHTRIAYFPKVNYQKS